MKQPGEYRIPFNGKYKGRKVRDVSKKEIERYLSWLESNSIQKGSCISREIKNLKDELRRFYQDFPATKIVAGSPS